MNIVAELGKYQSGPYTFRFVSRLQLYRVDYAYRTTNVWIDHHVLFEDWDNVYLALSEVTKGVIDELMKRIRDGRRKAGGR